MGTFKIAGSTMNHQYSYEDEAVVVTGSYSTDVQQGTVRNIHGSVSARNVAGHEEYVGDFSGVMREGELRYSLSEMTRENAAKTWAAIDAVEAQVLSAQEEVGV